MSTYTLLVDEHLNSDLGSIFERSEFFKLHANNAGHYFQWVKNEQVAASIHFTEVAPGQWRNPGRGTYAGLTHAAHLNLKDLCDFYQQVERFLREKNATRLEILPPPMSHDPVGFSHQVYLLRSLGFQISQCDINQSLEVDSRPLTDRMDYGNLKRFRKCTREGLTSQLLPINRLADVYDTLNANRASKGHSMSMTLAQLEAMHQAFPQSMVLFGCADGDVLAAAALCLKLAPDVLYVFYWGDRPGYQAYSPVVTIAHSIYAHAQALKIRLLDVGTSTLDDQPNWGLIEFKRGLGFNESLKLRMVKT